MKTLITSLACGFLLAACGGPLPEEGTNSAEPLSTSESALCEGYANGARRCSWQCTSSSGWIIFNGSVAEGQCQATANYYCGRTAYGTCWSF